MITKMTVKELIEHLKTFPEDLPVLYAIYSDNKMLEAEDIKIAKFMEYRKNDGYYPRNSDSATGVFRRFEGVSFPGN
jgi:hypothetical protein